MSGLIINPGCPRCEQYAAVGAFGQMFNYYCDPALVIEPLEVHFDVTTAIEIVSDGRTRRASYSMNPNHLPPNTWDGVVPEHVAHVPLDEPGIVCPTSFRHRGAEGWQTYALLIDGRNRAARLRELGKEFVFYVLTPEEAKRVTHYSLWGLAAASLFRKAKGAS